MRLVAILAVFLLLPQLASAHEVKHSGSLDILLHMEPGDDPVAREPAQMYFSVTDSDGKFRYADCLCRVSIRQNGQELFSRVLGAEDEAPDWGANVARVEFTYPQTGVYTVTLTGRPAADSFEDINLDYAVRVERESRTVPAQSALEEGQAWQPYAIGAAILVFGIIVFGYINKPRNKHK